MRAVNIFPAGRVSLGGVAFDRSRLAKQPAGLGLEGSDGTTQAPSVRLEKEAWYGSLLSHAWWGVSGLRSLDAVFFIRHDGYFLL